MKNIGKFAVLGAVLAISASFTSTAFADSVSGSVWENATFYPSNLPATAPAGTPTSTFTVSGTGNLFNFVSGTSNNLMTDPTYTLGGFLTSGGDTVTGLTHAGDTINDDIFEFTGVTVLTAGVTYGITHDDGMYLYLNGVPVISSPAPTSADDSTFTVATTGQYSFEMLYAEVNGAPAVLSGTLGTLAPAAPTPEPSSLVLLGSGLVSAAGMMLRKRATA